MERRDFLKLAAVSGLSVVTPMGVGREAHAEEKAFEPYTGSFLVAFNARGGWDPTYLCDPKGLDVNGINKSFSSGDILTAGNIKYAPRGVNQTFFDRFKDELLVLNGVDMSTNSHRSGTRYAWTGKREKSNYPTLAALIAGVKGANLPLAYLSFGGYDSTGNIVPLARVPRAERLRSLATANLIASDPNRKYHEDLVAQKIQAARNQRHEHHHSHLPRQERSRGVLFTAQLNSKELKRIVEFLPETMPTNGLQRQIVTALAAYKAGLCISVNVGVGAFDTHSDHDNKQSTALDNMLNGIIYMMDRAEELGIRDKVVVQAGSDFGRTPKYNKDNGKDHWSISSMMLMGPGISGNRVIGATDEEQKTVTLDPQTLQPSEDSQLKLRPEHVHHELRKLFGVENSEFAKEFKLEETPIPLING